jgi:DNA-binding transcriptional regulator LsrR (DeoR family)
VPNKTIRPTPGELLALAAAELHAQGLRGKAGVQILNANGHKVDEPKFAVLLHLARDKKFIRYVVDYSQFPREIQERVRIMTSDSYAELVAVLKGFGVKSLRVYYSGSDGQTPDIWRARLAHFSSLAAPRILELLRSSQYVGVGWGHTVTALVDALEHDTRVRGLKKRTLSFVPTCGEPLGPDARPDRASSALTARLNSLCGGGAPSLSLAGVAAVIPSHYRSRTERTAIRRYIRDIHDYRRVFGPLAHETPLAKRMDTLLTSIGSLEQGWHTYQSELIKVSGVPTKTLEALAIGDLNGALIPHRGLDRARRSAFRSIADSWTGLTIEDCRRIANNARNSSRVGVVAGGTSPGRWRRSSDSASFRNSSSITTSLQRSNKTFGASNQARECGRIASA